MGAAALDLATYLDPARMLILAGSPTRSELLERLSDVVIASGVVLDPPLFRQAIKDREGVTSTAIGNGIAVPHARLSSIADFSLAVAITTSGVDYAARDGMPVLITVMIASPEDERARHLQVLATVVSRLAQPTLRQMLLSATDATSVIRALAPPR